MASTDPEPGAVPVLGHLGAHAVVYPRARIVQPEHLSLGDHSTVDDFVFFNAGRRSTLGRYVHVAAHASIIGGGELEVGDYAVIATGVRVLTASDSDAGGAFMTTHAPVAHRAVRDAPVIIGRHAFVGANAVVMPGVTIGEGAVAGAGCVVTHDLEPWTVYIGAPARPLRARARPSPDEL
jgi:galactoside O-acetyltransferase